MLRSGLLVLIALTAVVPPATARAVTVTLTPLEAADVEAGLTAAPGLHFVEGVELSSPDQGFGGLSGFVLDPDGEGFTAVSDKGNWLSGRLMRDVSGGLETIEGARLQPIRNSDGTIVTIAKNTHDAEEVARFSNGDLLVAFERQNRILRYPPGEAMTSAQPQSLGFRDSAGRRFRRAQGLEAVIALADDQVLVIEEKRAGQADHLVGWRGRPDAGPPTRLRYTTQAGFEPVGMARLANGDILVLERRFSFLGGFTSRVVRIEAETAANAEVLRGERELLRLRAPGVADNFEAIATHPRADGATDMYLLSDDNFHFLQQTLLLRFVLEK